MHPIWKVLTPMLSMALISLESYLVPNSSGSPLVWTGYLHVKAGLQEPGMEPGKDHHRFFSLSFPPVPPDTHSLPCAPTDMPSAPPDIHCLPPAPPDTYSFLLHLQTPIVCLLHLLLPPAPLSTACLLHFQILLASFTSRYCLPPAPPDTQSDHWIYPNFEQVASEKLNIFSSWIF